MPQGTLVSSRGGKLWFRGRIRVAGRRNQSRLHGGGGLAYGILEATVVVRSVAFAVRDLVSNPRAFHLTSPMIKGRSFNLWVLLSPPKTWKW